MTTPNLYPPLPRPKGMDEATIAKVPDGGYFLMRGSKCFAVLCGKQEFGRGDIELEDEQYAEGRRIVGSVNFLLARDQGSEHTQFWHDYANWQGQ